MSDQLPIGIVFDASAVLSYVRGQVDVGETLIEVADNQAVAAIPVVSLATAWQVAVDRDRLMLLVDHSTTEVVGAAPHDWQSLALLAELTGDVETAAAALVANDNVCPVMSARPDQYGQIGDGTLAIPIGE